MVEFDFRSSDTLHLAEALESFPPNAYPRQWVLRDDNRQHYHGVVRLSQSPLYVELRWKPSINGPEQLVGRYHLHLAELLAANYVRFECEGEPGDEIRLRFFRGSGGVILIQTRAARPGLPIGHVDTRVASPPTRQPQPNED